MLRDYRRWLKNDMIVVHDPNNMKDGEPLPRYFSRPMTEKEREDYKNNG